MLKIVNTIKTSFLLYKIYGGLSVIFDDEKYIKEELNEINENSFLLKDVEILFYENTPMIQITGNLINISKYQESGKIEILKSWKFITSSYNFIFTPSKLTNSQLLND